VTLENMVGMSSFPGGTSLCNLSELPLKYIEIQEFYF